MDIVLSIILIILGILVIVIGFKKIGKNFNNSILNIIKRHIADKNVLKYSKYFINPMTSSTIDVLIVGIEGRILTGAKDFIKQGNNKLNRRISDASLKTADFFASSKNMKNYKFVSVTRSTFPEVRVGLYFYEFDENETLKLLPVPFEFVGDLSTMDYSVAYDVEYESEVISIEKSKIRDFQYFGSQLMELSSSNPSQPSLLGTMFSEIFLGTSYTLLKGLSQSSMQIKSEMKDYRVVQVILDEKTDIEFSGISIFYEFNRLYGKVKNKEVLAETVNKEQKETNTLDYSEELKKLKELFDTDLITKEEYDSKRKKILGI